MRQNTLLSTLAVAACALMGPAASAITIDWSTVQTTSGTVTTPANVPNAPNGLAATIQPFASLTASQFTNAVFYNDAAFMAALGLSSIPQFNVIVVEFGTPAEAPWEGTQFAFSDGSNTVNMQVNNGTSVGIPNYIVAAGQIPFASYNSLFSASPSAGTLVSYLLINVTGVNVSQTGFSVTMNGFNGSTPDPDAVGIIPPGTSVDSPEPGTGLLMIGAGGVALLRVLRKSR